MAETRSRLTELPVSPHTALAVHFGMLLGVSDIELLGANPRGKLWLHNAWLHGEGVVYGFRITFNAGSREVTVEPGMALDSRGRELYLGGNLCLNLDKWFEENKQRLGVNGRDVELDLDVAIRYRACLNRPVPALAGECDDSPESAYSRVLETVQVDLEKPVARVPKTFVRLRRALGLTEGPLDPAVLTPTEGAPQELVTADSLDLAPSEDDPPVIVARLRVTVADGRPDIAVGAIDHTVRTVHLPTTLVAELLAPHAPAGAHLHEHDVVWVDDQHVTIGTSAPLHEPTLAGNVAGHRWDADHWEPLAVAASIDNGRLSLDLGEPIAAGTTVRIVVTGSGATPVTADVDGRPTPLAGDVVLTLERS